MGRKGAGAAAGDAVSMADAGEASDDEEEPTEERYTDPWAEEDEPYDPAADASGGAGAACWLLHVARAIHTAYSGGPVLRNPGVKKQPYPRRGAPKQKLEVQPWRGRGRGEIA